MLPGVDQLQRDSLGRYMFLTGGSGYRPTGNKKINNAISLTFWSRMVNF
jgi:hypothetical protein